MAKYLSNCAICGIPARLNFSPSCPHLPPTYEPGADGMPQAVLPGAEQVTHAAIAQRRADMPLRPKATQRPCDAGLFSDQSQQKELFK
jgi:hypothetical protein